MCGIAGFCSRKVNSVELIESMMDAIIHRGPDDGMYYIDESTGVTLGHRRLAIIDLSQMGAQPMTSADNRFVIAYNGEIYNAEDIRLKLIKEYSGIRFRGSSDTEVLLEAIVRWGLERACQEAVGMFALVLYDKDKKTISFARDRIGEKPLYYGYIGGELVFASDLSAIVRHPNFENKIAEHVIDEYLRYGYISAPRSIYENIYKLRPGTIITMEYPYHQADELVYYDTKSLYEEGLKNPYEGSYDEAVDALDALLRTSVKRQMISDVPLGAYLSGGIDSATIVALMQDMCTRPVETFTIGFQDKKYDESNEASIIADYLSTSHTSLLVTEQELVDIVPKLSDIFSEPMGDSSQIPTYLVSKLARSKVTVALSGDAGDELFGGYNTYWKIASIYKKLNKIPKPICNISGNLLKNSRIDKLYRIGNSLLSDNIAQLHDQASFSDSYLRPRVGDRELLLGEDADILDEMMLHDLLNYHPNDILVKVDRAGMAVSLENRVPMLDRDVLSFVYSLPTNYKLASIDGNIVTKRILKDVLYRYVPKEMMERPKKGFSVPLERWLREGPVKDMADDCLTASHLAKAGIIDQEWIDKVRLRVINKGTNTRLLWNVFVLEQWYRKYC